MITKDNLLGMLEKSLANEDGFIIQYGKSFLKNIEASNELSAEDKQELNNLFGVLLQDTQRHSEAVSGLIDKIKKDSCNEY